MVSTDTKTGIGCGLTRERPRILYVVYWGAAEPLGQSLVLPAVKKLADLGAELTLVTFEKPRDLSRSEEIVSIRETLSSLGIRWIPLRYHKHPKVPATAFDFLQGCVRSIVSQLGARPDVIHARTFVGGLMGLALATALRTKLIYHNEGFYPDEQVDGGVWQAGSRPHRIATFLEQRMYARADGIIALSNRAKSVIENLPGARRKGTPVIVVPSCVDLDHFQSNPSHTPVQGGVLRLVYIGSVGGRYILDKVGRFVAVASREGVGAHLHVVTRTDRSLVDSMLRSGGLPEGSWSVKSVPYGEMPGELRQRHAGLFFLTQGLSEHGCSPTKIAEYWAMGLPVVTTPNVSDTDEIIRRERVGVIIGEHSDRSYGQAVRELRALLEDEDLAARCRRAAAVHYALEPACERQLSLYNNLAFSVAQGPALAGASEFGKP